MSATTQAENSEDANTSVIPSPRRPDDAPAELTSHQILTDSGARPRAGYGAWLRRTFCRNWVLELSVLLLLVIAYNFVRALPRETQPLAFAHGRGVQLVEGPVFELLEKPLNAWMAGIPVVAIAACYFYAVMHYAATPIVFFLSRRRGGWRYWRGYWSIVIASGLALAVYALYPVAPPRLLPDLGIVDVMRSFAGYGWWGNAASAPRGIGDATNQFAAMPSMHFGWALWCSIQMWGFGRTLWRWLAVLYPSLLAVIVIGTGNHFVLDLLGGAACVLVAYTFMDVLRAARRQLQT